MAAQYSQQWWVDLAIASGNRLTKAVIEAATGMNFDSIPQPGSFGTGAVLNWAFRVSNEAPGFKASTLLLSYSGQATPIPASAHDSGGPGFMAWINSPAGKNYPDNNYFEVGVWKDASGVVVPGPAPTTTAPAPNAPNPFDVPPDVRSGYPGWISFGVPAWPGGGASDTLFIDPNDLALWQRAAMVFPPTAPAAGVFLDLTNNRVNRTVKRGDPVFPGTSPPVTVAPPNTSGADLLIPDDPTEPPPGSSGGDTFIDSPTDGGGGGGGGGGGVPSVDAVTGGASMLMYLGGAAALLWLVFSRKDRR